MLIPRNLGRLAVLVGAVTLSACGGSQTGGGACDYEHLERGCVGLLNFYGATSQQMGGITVPAPTVSGGMKSPGIATQMVSNTSVNSTNAFQAVVNGVSVNVSCTVTSNGWVDVNPGVVLQPSGILTCINW